ncbi:unnamed protein product [Strongylus vulgaris]|uniref:Uncharacterized protein n=1 Tax=Strongylus vulgaris TaxID=40348 RepID=A0A3P7I161_STRVU|nr:unnamed protein product [Strongylus vulgaris]
MSTENFKTHLVLLHLVDGGGQFDHLMLKALAFTVDPEWKFKSVIMNRQNKLTDQNCLLKNVHSRLPVKIEQSWLNCSYNSAQDKAVPCSEGTALLWVIKPSL